MRSVQATPERIEAQTARLDRPEFPDVQHNEKLPHDGCDVVDTNDIAITPQYRARLAAFGSDAVTELETARLRFDWDVDG